MTTEGSSACPSCANCPSGYFAARAHACLVGQIKTMLSHISPRQEGRSATVTTREVGGDGLSVWQRAVRERTNNIGRTAKSCGPGLPVLRSSSRQYVWRCADDGGKNAGPQGERV